MIDQDTKLEMEFAIRQSQLIAGTLTNEGNAGTPLIDSGNIDKFNEAMGLLLDYYITLIPVAEPPL